MSSAKEILLSKDHIIPRLRRKVSTPPSICTVEVPPQFLNPNPHSNPETIDRWSTTGRARTCLGTMVQLPGGRI